MRKLLFTSVFLGFLINSSAQNGNFVYEIMYNNSNHNNLSDNLEVNLKTRVSCYFGYRVGRSLIFGFGQHYFYIDDRALTDQLANLFYPPDNSVYGDYYSSYYYSYSNLNHNWNPSLYLKLLLPLNKHIDVGLHFEYQFGRLYREFHSEYQVLNSYDTFDEDDRTYGSYSNFNISPEIRLNLCEYWGLVINFNGYNKMKYPSSFKVSYRSEGRNPEREILYNTNRSFKVDYSSWSFGTYFYF